MKLKTLGIVFLAGLTLTGCMSTMQRPAPLKSKTPIYTIKYKPDSMNFPVGSLVVDDSSVVIRSSMTDGQANGVMVSTVLFGVVGALVANSAMQSNTEKHITNAGILKKINLPQITFTTLRQMKKQKKLLPILQPVNHMVKGKRYELRPFLYFEANAKKQKELLVFLRVVQYDNANKKRWLGQYVKHINMRNTKLLLDEKILNHKIGTALQETINVFNQDLKGKLKKNENKKVTIKVKDSLTYGDGLFWGWILPSKNKKEIIFQARMYPESVHGGIHIFEKKDVKEIRVFK